MLRVLVAAPVQQELGTLANPLLDVAEYLLLVLLGDQRAHRHARLHAVPDLELLGLRDQLVLDLAVRLPDREHHAVRQDRKSTRLNSSHGYISYAVFCLKKKTHRTATRRA